MLFSTWLPASLIYKCKVLIQVMWKKWQCWSICATQISNQRDTFLNSDSLIEVISLRSGISSALGGCFSAQIICPFSDSDKEHFMEMHPCSRHLNGVCWSGACELMRLLPVNDKHKKQRKCHEWALLWGAVWLHSMPVHRSMILVCYDTITVWFWIWSQCVFFFSVTSS